MLSPHFCDEPKITSQENNDISSDMWNFSEKYRDKWAYDGDVRVPMGREIDKMIEKLKTKLKPEKSHEEGKNPAKLNHKIKGETWISNKSNAIFVGRMQNKQTYTQG